MGSLINLRFSYKNLEKEQEFCPDTKALLLQKLKMRKSTEQKLKDMRAMYENGASIKEIADKMGYKTGTVQTMLSKTGVFRKRNIDDYLQQMIQMRLEGKKLGEISRATGFSIPRICEKLKEAGCGKNSMRDTYAESDIDESKLTYAAPRKAPERVEMGGKRYVDVMESVFDTPDIRSL